MEQIPNQPSPKVEVGLNGDVDLVLTYRDTYLVGFENCYADDEYDYSHMNHVVHVMEDGEVISLYRSEEVYRQLAQLAFSRVVKPYPEQEDIDDYVQFFEAEMNGEINEYFNDDDDWEEYDE